jgi:hypothetical protein
MLDVRALRLRPHLSLTFVTALTLAAAILGGCGSDNSGSGRKLSRATSASLQGTLDKVQADVGAGNCSEAAQEAANLRQQIDALPRAGRSLRRALASSAARLESLVADQCKPVSTTPTVESKGATGTTGEQGTSGEQKGKKEKKPKPPKKPKGQPGQDEGGLPGQQGDGGGAGLPGESNPDGGTQP